MHAVRWSLAPLPSFFDAFLLLRTRFDVLPAVS